MTRKIRSVPYLQLQDEHGNPIRKEARGNALDEFLRKMDDPNYWITIPGGEELQPDLILSKEELDIIERIEANQYGDSNYDPYEPLNEFFTGKVQQTPIGGQNEPKSRFIPSAWEHKRVMKIVLAIRNGLIRVEDGELVKEGNREKKQKVYDIWEGASTEEDAVSLSLRITAPKVALPDSSESYNPPASLLPTQKQIDQWNSTSEEKRAPFLPRRYNSLRSVPGYAKFALERFSRCLDLYLCPRALRRKTVVDPDELLPPLPDINELRPFPSKLALQFVGHTGAVRSVSTLHTGNWLLSGSEDCSVRAWEVETGRAHLSWSFPTPISCVQWNPNPNHCMIGVATGNRLFLAGLDLLGTEVQTRSDELLFSNSTYEPCTGCEWGKTSLNGTTECLEIAHPHPIVRFSWHPKGDYISVVCSTSSQSWLFIHQLSKHRTQSPFKRTAGTEPIIQAQFHSAKPWLYVATDRYVRLFDLSAQHEGLGDSLRTKVQGRSINCFDIFPSAKSSHLLLGTREARTMWYDLDMSATEPFKTMRYHRAAIRMVRYHRRFPIFASCGDDGTVQLFHCKVYEDDLLKNPVLIPLHVIRDCIPTDGVGTLALDFHPTQAWLFTGASDNSIRLYT